MNSKRCCRVSPRSILTHPSSLTDLPFLLIDQIIHVLLIERIVLHGCASFRFHSPYLGED